MIPKKKARFNKHERAILASLYGQRRPMNLSELSRKSDTSWVTTKNYVQNLQRRGIIVAPKLNPRAKKKKFKFNFDIFP